MHSPTRDEQIRALEQDWAENPRWKGIRADYSASDVVRLRGSVRSSTRWRAAARRSSGTWSTTEPFVNTLGALTGNQAMQQVKAGLKAIYLSGWQVAGDANIAGEMYPDQSLYPVNSVPPVVKRINNTFTRADQIQWSEGKDDIDYFAPIVADAEAGFGGVLNAFELMKSMIDAGAAGVHFEDQLASVKKCGHMGGKVLVPTREAVVEADRRAPRRRRDGRADAPDRAHRRRGRRPGDARRRRQRQAVPHRRAHARRASTAPSPASTRRSRAASPTAPYADMIWCETGKPDLAFAKAFAEAIHKQVPGQAARLQLLAELQLEEEPRRRDDRQVPARARRDGLQVPVHHAGRLPQPQLLDVQPGARLRARTT